MQQLLDPKSEESRRELIAEIKQQRSLLEVYRDISRDVVAKTYYNRTGQRIKDITANKGDLLVGIFNVED